MSERAMQEADRERSTAGPSLARQAWNVARAMADFVVDGCRTVEVSEYRRRLEICDACNERRGNRCMKCGCRLALKARGWAFQCPRRSGRRLNPVTEGSSEWGEGDRHIMLRRLRKMSQSLMVSG